MELGCHIVQLQCIPVACTQYQPRPQFGRRGHSVHTCTVPTGIHYSTPPLDLDWYTVPIAGTNESDFDKGCSILF